VISLFFRVSGAVALCLGIGLYAFLMAGYFLAAPSQQPEKADLMVSLGGEYGSRVKRAAELYRQGYSSRILLTGYEGGPIGPQPYFLNWRPQFLDDNGVPKSALLFDASARNTWEEAVITLALLKQRGWKRVIVVSDAPHMRRLHWVWSKVFSGSDIEFVLVSSAPEWWNPARWWGNDQSRPFVVMEYIKLVYYIVIY
jgi:uncharacterized SAM-binding protein YcdF (DUF218 family)